MVQEGEKRCDVCLGDDENAKETQPHGQFRCRLGGLFRKHQLAPFTDFLTYFLPCDLAADNSSCAVFSVPGFGRSTVPQKWLWPRVLCLLPWTSD